MLFAGHMPWLACFFVIVAPALASPLRFSFSDLILHTDRANAPTCTTSAGWKGKATSAGACRYVVKYAHAERWAYSLLTTDVAGQDMIVDPPPCPQDGIVYTGGREQSEDCLYASVYTPPKPTGKMPVFVWVHGGSFVAGSTSAPGLDGSKLAVEGDMVVILLQYRLGALGFLPPGIAESASDPNLGMLDVINGLKAINSYVELFQGDPSRVTIGGQSAGAGMIRAMLGSPAAQGLFRAAILQSDPMSYGLAPPNITNALREAYYSDPVFKTCDSLDCFRNISFSDVVSAQQTLLSEAPYTIRGLPLVEVFRPTYGTTTIPHDPTPLLFQNPSALVYPPTSIPLLLTSVRNEAGGLIASLFPAPIPASNTTFNQVVTTYLGASRAAEIIKSRVYVPGTDSTDSMREILERMVTDGICRCANLDVAKSWTGQGGTVWVGDWRQGIRYSLTQAQGSGYCDVDGRVCHEDEIYPTFGTSPSSKSQRQDWEKDVMTRWIAFIKHLDPNPPAKNEGRIRSWLLGFVRKAKGKDSPKRWRKFVNSADVLGIGGDGKTSNCPPGLWGNKVQYDWQLYSP